MNRHDDRRLIEDYLPIEAISAEASREKSVRKGHISTLHLWWARRPLVACRAAVYGALVPASQFAPNNGPEGRKPSLGRANAAKFLERLCKYPGDPRVIQQAQQHILQAHAERLTAELAEARKLPSPAGGRGAGGEGWPEGAPRWLSEFNWPRDKTVVTYDDILAGRAPRLRVLDMFAGGGGSAPPGGWSNPWWEGTKGFFLGLGQGTVNLVNGVQDMVVGVINVVPGSVNAIAWAEERVGILNAEDPIRVPYIPSPDWSRGLITHEAGTPGSWSDTHGWSKFAGATGVGAAAGAWTADAAKAARVATAGGAGRSFGEVIKDVAANPSKWQIVRKEIVPSTNIRNKGGWSVQELLRNSDTGEEVVRHTLLKADGTLFELPHFRPFWK